jgi:hypothetical protein
MSGEQKLTTNQSGVQFPDATFLHNVDKPFEVHRAKPSISVLDAQDRPLTTALPQDNLQQFARVRLNDLGKNELMLKAPTLVSQIVKGSSEATWEWAEPYTIVRSESFQVVADCLDLTNLIAAIAGAAKIQLNWMFQGFLIVVAPPSESR